MVCIISIDVIWFGYPITELIWHQHRKSVLGASLGNLTLIPYFFLMHPSISVIVKWCSCCIWEQLIGQTRQMSRPIYLTLHALCSLSAGSRPVYYFCLHKDNQISLLQRNQCCRSTFAWHWSIKSQGKVMGKKELCLKLEASNEKWGSKNEPRNGAMIREGGKRRTFCLLVCKFY